MIPSKTTDAETISFVKGLDGRNEPQPAPDPDAPHDHPHETHAWVLHDRWASCTTCGTRDHWPGAGQACPKGPKPERAPPVSLDEALARLARDLEVFATWWRSKGLGESRPDYAEWTAEFLEWTRTPSGAA